MCLLSVRVYIISRVEFSFFNYCLILSQIATHIPIPKGLKRLKTPYKGEFETRTPSQEERSMFIASFFFLSKPKFSGSNLANLALNDSAVL